MTKRKAEAPPPQYSQHSSHKEPKSETKTDADIPTADLPINVLIIGETQNGKSTMIRQMGVYAGVPELNIRIGFGRTLSLRLSNQFNDNLRQCLLY